MLQDELNVRALIERDIKQIENKLESALEALEDRDYDSVLYMLEGIGINDDTHNALLEDSLLEIDTCLNREK
jgi:hypothetical protein